MWINCLWTNKMWIYIYIYIYIYICCGYRKNMDIYVVMLKKMWTNKMWTYMLLL